MQISACQNQQKSLPLLGDVHEHTDFKVYLNGTPLNFAKQKYMSAKDRVIDNFMHLHDLDGQLIHQHMSTTTLKDFFASLNMSFTADCFVTDNNAQYCNNGDSTIKMYVNGVKNEQFEDYDFNDLDRILITYGNEDAETIQKQIESVSDKACIQSLKCPERGKPNDEATCLSGSDCVVATGVQDDN